MKTLTRFEREMKMWRKKRKNNQDQEIIDEFLLELKKKNEREKQNKINELTEQLERAKR